MGEGLFLLLCVLALIIGTRARNSKLQTPQSIARKTKTKRILSFIALVVIGLMLLFFIPSIYTETLIAIDTQFTNENYLGFVLIAVGIFTFISILKKLKKSKV